MDKHYERIVKTYYDGLEDGKILARKCTRCGHIEFPPRIACNECGCPKTEWSEIPEKVYATWFNPQNATQSNAQLTKEVGDFMWATIQLEGGTILDNMNCLVFGATKDRLEELNAKVPVPVKPKIVQRDGYKQVFWELDE